MGFVYIEATVAAYLALLMLGSRKRRKVQQDG